MKYIYQAQRFKRWKRNCFLGLSSFLLFTCSVSAQLSGTYQIDQNGGGPGTYADFTSAISDLMNLGVSGNVTFEVAPGTYNEQLTIPSIAGASTSSRIVFRGSTGDANDVMLSFLTSNVQNYVIQLDAASHLSFEDIRISSTNTTANEARGVYLTASGFSGGVSDVEFKGCILTTTYSEFPDNAAIYAENGTDGLRIIDCDFGHSYGIYLSADPFINHQNLTVSGNEYKSMFHANNMAPLPPSDVFQPILLRWSGSATITGNTIQRAFVSSFPNPAVVIENTSNLTFSENIIRVENGGCARFSSINAGFSFGAASIFNNLFLNQFDFQRTLVDVSASNNVAFYHNTIHSDYNQNSSTNYLFGLQVYGSTFNGGNYGNEAYNNLISMRKGIAFSIDGLSGFGFVDYNLYYNGSGATTFEKSGQNFTTVSDFQGQIYPGSDVHSFQVNPEFSNTYDLVPLRPCLYGKQSSASKDLKGNSRGTQFYVGAINGPVLEDYNLSVIDILQPNYPVYAGSQDLMFRVQNIGVQTVTTFNAAYQLNANTPVTQTVSTSLSTCAFDTFTFNGNNSINIQNKRNNLKLYTDSPNGFPDAVAENDTINKEICLALKGDYTLGGSNPDFVDLDDLNSSLVCSGIDSNVRIFIQAGTYTGALILENIKGVSSANHLEFIGVGGTVRIQINSNYQNKLSALYMKGTPYVSFKHINFRSTMYYSIRPIAEINGGCDFLNIDSCLFDWGTTNTAFGAIGILLGDSYFGTSSNEISDNITISNSVIESCATSLKATGDNFSPINNLTITNCDFDGPGVQGLFGTYLQNLEFSHNKIEAGIGFFSGLDRHGAFLELCSGTNFSSNEITGAFKTGLWLSSENAFINSISTITNNLIALNGTQLSDQIYGIKLEFANNLKVAHNSIHVDEAQASGQNNRPHAGLGSINVNNAYFMNNIIEHVGIDTRGGAIYEESSGNVYWNYNLLYSDQGSILTQAMFSGLSNYTLEEWKSLEPLSNENSETGQAQFVSNTNLRLKSGTDLIFGSDTLNIAFDIDGDPRCSFAPTIGADESTFPNSPLTATILAKDSLFAGALLKFTNTTNTLGRPYQMQWKLDGTSKGFEDAVYFTVNDTSTHYLQLNIRNCSYADSFGISFKPILPTSTPVADFIANRQVIDLNQSVQLFDNSSHGANQFQWSVIPSQDVFFDNAFGPKPIVAFLKSGKFTVCLSAANHLGAGTDTCKQDYILVRENYAMCSGSGVTRVPEGFVTDDRSSITGGYGNNQNCTLLIDPCATDISLNFQQLQLADGGDRLRIYDGTDTSGNLLASFTGPVSLPQGFGQALVANTGKVFIAWSTNSSGQAFGWKLEYSSNPIFTSKPDAQVSLPDTVYAKTKYTFTSGTDEPSAVYTWDFQYPQDVEGDASSRFNQREYSWSSVGTYSLYHQVENCGGKDDFTQAIQVIQPTSSPVAGFKEDTRRVLIQKSVHFEDTSLYGAHTLKWEIIPSIGSEILGDDTEQDIEVKFTKTGFYSVQLIATNDLGSDTVLKQAHIEVFDYCTPGNFALNNDLGISQFNFASIANSSAMGTKEYTDYTNVLPAATVIQGGTYALTIKRTSNVNAMTRKVWIDYNFNGVFESTELVAFEPSANTLEFNTQVTIPRNASTGLIRLRVATDLGNALNTACGMNQSGEYEDYQLNIVADEVKPAIQLTGGDTIAIEQWYSFIEPGITITDNVDGMISQYTTISNFDSSQTGLYTVRYITQDTAGNINDQVIRYINVLPDQTKPVITLVGPMVDTLEVLNSYMEPGFTATDYFNRVLTSLVKIQDNTDSSLLSSYSRKYYIEDLAGNKDSVFRTIVVADRTSPVITLLGPDTVYVSVNAAYQEPGVQVSDNYSASITLNTDDGKLNTAITGVYSIAYHASDASGNKSMKQRVVVVEDKTKPQLVLNGLDTLWLDVYTNYQDLGVQVTDNYCTVNQLTTQNYPNTNKLGSYTMQYYAVDCEGNVSDTLQRVIHVEDREAPVLILKGLSKETIQRYQGWNDPGIQIMDNYYSTAVLSPLVNITTNYSNGSPEGLYEWCYDLTDPSGNIAQRVCRTIEIIENTTSVQPADLSKSITVFPNPFLNKIQIQASLENQLTGNLKLYSIRGELLESLKLDHGVVLEINTQNIAPGSYILVIETDAGIVRKKLIKQ